MQLIVVSARTPASLRAYLQRLHDFLVSRAVGLSLEDVAYTLQVGRKALDERWATVAASVEELMATLAGEDRAALLYRGRAGHTVQGEIVDVTDLDALARHWVKGGQVRWDALPRRANIRRIGLPTYAFEKKR